MEILYEEEGLYYIGLSWEDTLKGWVIHIQITEELPKVWSVSKAKEFFKLRDRLREILRSRGIYEIYGLSDTPKEVKYNMLLGAEDTGIIVETEEGKNKYLVKGVI